MSADLGLLQRLTRLYTFYSPIRRGKNRLALASLSRLKQLPGRVTAATADGRTLKVNFDNHFAWFIYFLGEYEPGVTQVAANFIEKGDVCLDIGANFGWYTTFFQSLVGRGGQVHCFEPLGPIFKVLLENIEKNDNAVVVRANNLALGTENKSVTLRIPPDKSDGHATLARGNRQTERGFAAEMIRLDEYLEENRLSDVKLVKADIEGAELDMLRGARKLFEQKKPPIWIVEMALETTREFDYRPNDLIEYIGRQCDYDFYAIDEKTAVLQKITGFQGDDPGANVLCVPRGLYEAELGKLKIVSNNR